MVKIRIRKNNPSGKTEARFQLITGEWIKVNTVDWTEVDTSDFNNSSPNPNFFEIEGEKLPEAKTDGKKKPK